MVFRFDSTFRLGRTQRKHKKIKTADKPRRGQKKTAPGKYSVRPYVNLADDDNFIANEKAALELVKWLSKVGLKEKLLTKKPILTTWKRFFSNGFAIGKIFESIFFQMSKSQHQFWALFIIFYYVGS